ncbi:hypothetical protein [Hyalangium minutum]|nr:hypothetical protein [Hyalangium minutum]
MACRTEAPNLETPTMKTLIAAIALVATTAFASEPAKTETKPAPAAEAKTDSKGEAKPEAAKAEKDGKKADAPKTAAETK